MFLLLTGWINWWVFVIPKYGHNLSALTLPKETGIKIGKVLLYLPLYLAPHLIGKWKSRAIGSTEDSRLSKPIASMHNRSRNNPALHCGKQCHHNLVTYISSTGLNPGPGTALHCPALYSTVLHCTVLHCTESVPRREEGSTGKYQHEVEGTPKTKCWYFPLLPDSSQGTEIIQFINVMKH